MLRVTYASNYSPRQKDTYPGQGAVAPRRACGSVGWSGPTSWNNSCFLGVICIATDATNQDGAHWHTCHMRWLIVFCICDLSAPRRAEADALSQAV